MKLDGYQIEKGDKLFDTELRGVVTARIVNADAVICQALSGQRKLTLTYNPKGISATGRHRVLFWQNPLFIIPPKNISAWRAQQDVIRSSVESMARLASKMDVSQLDEDTDPTITSVLTAGERGLLNEQDLHDLLAYLREEL